MFGHVKEDSVAGFVVFLVAVPLCLGIAIACGVPPISGLIAGIVGGLVVPWISRSALSVTGPAAGLTSIVLVEVQNLGGVNPFLTAVMIAGALQVLLGVIRAGRFAALVPSSVIKGMLAAIGITIILKQLPVAVGSAGGLSTMLTQYHLGPVTIALVSLAILYGWKHTPLAKLKLISPALVVVLVASGLAVAFAGSPTFALDARHFVNVPLGGVGALYSALPRPEWAAFMNPTAWIAGATIAVVASIETLLSLQAIDRLDPLKRHSPPDRELLAQGAANAVSGFLGGLPVTAVIVRSGANVAAGGRERFSALVHGLLLLGAVLFAGPLLNRIPLACLAAVLIQVGLNLCKPALFTTQVKLGMTQLLPFALTIAAVLALDLLKGVILGIFVGIAFVLYENSKRAVVAEKDDAGVWQLRFRRDGTFVSKPGIVTTLDEVDDGESVVIDGSGEYIDHDVKEVLATFIEDAHHRNITVTVRGIDLSNTSAGGGH
ncbi:SulP family inorganic anion transporter [Gemmatimonas sp.]|uniref:SulP family inorganic anion transporter n=1 Tax=Gemmatimonas sp. TaxID=1962908 RepID=UPI00286D6413|nr:SulP family inorganic anion transporter [Gemmatimonas sp.]